MNWRPDFRTLGLVTLVTVLIWVWAEGESLQRESITVAISFVDDQPRKIILRVEEGLSGSSGSVLVGLEGSNLAVSAARRRLITRALELRPGEGAVPIAPGTHVLSVRDLIREHPDLENSAVVITGVDPAEVTVRIVEMIDHPMVVDVRLPPDSQGVRVVNTPEVSVRMPKGLPDELAEADTAYVVVRENDLRGVPAGVPRTFNLPVRLSDALAAKPDVVPPTASVEVILEVAASTDSHTLATVPVWVALPPTQINRWNVDLQDQFLANVKVSGPTEVISQLVDGRISIIAEVALDTQDLEARIPQKSVRFIRTDGESTAGLKFPSPAPVARLRIEPRLEGGAGGPGTDP